MDGIMIMDNVRTDQDHRMDALDATKMVLAVFVVAVHARLLPDILNPLLRTAVPLFFMMSSYLFFRKQADISRLRKFLGRNLRLYGFWFVILLPITLKIRVDLSEGLLPVLGRLLHNFVFYSTFRASWYIIALCTAMVIVYLLSQKVSDWVLLAVSVPVYLLYCLFSNYYGLLAGWPVWTAFCQGYQAFFVTLCNNFPAAPIWIVLGKCFAESKIRIAPGKSIWLLAGSFVLLLAEHFCVLHFALAGVTDFYVFLVPLCVAAFSLLISVRCNCEKAPIFRKISTVTYVLHSSALVIIDLVYRQIFHLQGVVLAVSNFVTAVIVCVVATLAILYFEKYRLFRWLKWAY